MIYKVPGFVVLCGRHMQIEKGDSHWLRHMQDYNDGRKSSLWEEGVFFE